ncbi:unnamed protein product [Prorocentrum cordatum]|uniref:Uncharacterized protein n=1 Tax=Prorocentrum cordatum TaxID=2364126 RepID=A0ABN9RYV5_9DINO|nr:unnamed protein product [Polarella glacialis]
MVTLCGKMGDVAQARQHCMAATALSASTQSESLQVQLSKAHSKAQSAEKKLEAAAHKLETVQQHLEARRAHVGVLRDEFEQAESEHGEQVREVHRQLPAHEQPVESKPALSIGYILDAEKLSNLACRRMASSRPTSLSTNSRLTTRRDWSSEPASCERASLPWPPSCSKTRRPRWTHSVLVMMLTSRGWRPSAEGIIMTPKVELPIVQRRRRKRFLQADRPGGAAGDSSCLRVAVACVTELLPSQSPDPSPLKALAGTIERAYGAFPAMVFLGDFFQGYLKTVVSLPRLSTASRRWPRFNSGAAGASHV